MGNPQHSDTYGPPRRTGGLGRIRCRSWQKGAGGAVQWRDAPGCWRHERRCGCTFGTGTSTTPWLCWRRATSPYHCAPWRPGGCTGGTVVGGGYPPPESPRCRGCAGAKVHPHRRLCRQHPRASLHWTAPPAPFRLERHLIRPGPPFVWGVHRCRRAAAFPCRVIR